MISRERFEINISDYVRDTLVDTEKVQIEEYLEFHPEALQMVNVLWEIIRLTDQIHKDLPPSGLIKKCRAKLEKNIDLIDYR